MNEDIKTAEAAKKLLISSAIRVNVDLGGESVAITQVNPAILAPWPGRTASSPRDPVTGCAAVRTSLPPSPGDIDDSSIIRTRYGPLCAIAFRIAEANDVTSPLSNRKLGSGFAAIEGGAGATEEFFERADGGGNKLAFALIVPDKDGNYKHAPAF